MSVKFVPPVCTYTTFEPEAGLHCEHCPELAGHRLETPATDEPGMNLCPKCLRDAVDVLSSLENFKEVRR